jgi:hypothetical protein
LERRPAEQRQRGYRRIKTKPVNHLDVELSIAHISTMPVYHFHLVAIDGRVLDPEGTELPDEASAREHARQVACELMRHCEPQTRSCRMEVTDSAWRPCFELLFASVDSTIDHLTPEGRASVENLCSQFASLSQTIHTVESTLMATRATLARFDGRCHLAGLPSVERR